MDLPALIAAARDAGASDLHLEAGLPPSARIRGRLQPMGAPLAARELLEAARDVVGEDRWPGFLERRSADVARNLGGVRCRVNALCTARGVGLAIRFLPTTQATLERLNLRADLVRLVEPHHGLVIVSGPTGSGKSSTLAALVQELNLREARHVVTLESPIEYTLTPRQSFIRQREVGRDTPSFEQGLYDAMREDPDVLVVGELRDAETMRLTLSAAETGHLVLTTVHSSSTGEALQRIVGAFPAEIQAGIATQLADCLVGVVCQRLRFFPERNLRAPECGDPHGQPAGQGHGPAGAVLQDPHRARDRGGRRLLDLRPLPGVAGAEDRLVRALARASAAGARGPGAGAGREGRARRPEAGDGGAAGRRPRDPLVGRGPRPHPRRAGATGGVGGDGFPGPG